MIAKRIAIIDIGSNSARLVIFQKTSLYGFHLICEQKSRVRIGEGAYENGGQLQEIGMNRAFFTLQSFSQTIKEFEVDKTISVATSALRDAPNREIFLNKVQNELQLHIKVISGKEEALYGAIAANNLLPITDGITIDIGGGSSDMALIKNSKIIDTHTLNLGTVRLKELFFDAGASKEDVRHYIQDALSNLPKNFHSKLAIGIGGTIRSLAKSIIKKTKYPLSKLHAFSYNIEEYLFYFEDIINAKPNELTSLYIKENRLDTIREGTFIFLEILRHIEAKQVITSGAGVREGVYLHHKLSSNEYIFPRDINPSIVSIKDRFDILGFPDGNKTEIAKKLYDIFGDQISKNKNYLETLHNALSLSNIGKILTIYHKNRHAYYIAMQELNYCFTHKEMALIAVLLNTKHNKSYSKELYTRYQTLLPKKSVFEWLSFIYTLTLILNKNSTRAKITFEYRNKCLDIKSDMRLYLAEEELKNMKKTKDIEVIIS